MINYACTQDISTGQLVDKLGLLYLISMLFYPMWISLLQIPLQCKLKFKQNSSHEVYIRHLDLVWISVCLIII